MERRRAPPLSRPACADRGQLAARRIDLPVNLRTAWTPQRAKGWEVYAELLNAFDSDDDDIDYFYETRFPGEPAGGVLDRNSRVVEPRQVRIGVKKTF